MAASQLPPLARPRRPPPWLAPNEQVPPPPDPKAGVTEELARALRSLSADHGRRALTPLVALLISWSGAFVLVWSAAVGAVLGVLVFIGAIGASGTTRSLFDSGPGRGVSLWHVVSGALAGSSGTTLAAFRVLFSSVWGLGASLGSGLVVAALVVVSGAVAERHLLELRGFRRPSMGELRRLARALQRFDASLHGPESPAFVVADTGRALLRVCTGHLVVSTGLLDALDDDELAAVLCRGVHQWRSGFGSWRALVVACGWPIFALESLGDGLADSDGDHPARGAGSALVGLMVWPARVLVRFVLVPVMDHGRQSAEYDADAAVARAGHGPGLMAALSKLSAVSGPGRGFDAVLAAGMPPVVLRMERLGPVRPLDAFFREPEEEPAGAKLRRRGAMVGMAVALLLLAAGAGLNAANTAAANTAAANTAATRRAAVRSAAAFTVSYLDDLFSPGAAHDTVTAFVPPGQVAHADAAARSSVLGLTAVLAGADAGMSHARATGCQFVASPGHAGSAAQVLVRARWDYVLGRIPHRTLLTSNVAMAFVGGRWQPISTPAVSVMGTAPSGIGGSGEIPCR